MCKGKGFNKCLVLRRGGGIWPMWILMSTDPCAEMVKNHLDKMLSRGWGGGGYGYCDKYLLVHLTAACSAGEKQWDSNNLCKIRGEFNLGLIINEWRIPWPPPPNHLPHSQSTYMASSSPPKAKSAELSQYLSTCTCFKNSYYTQTMGRAKARFVN